MSSENESTQDSSSIPRFSDEDNNPFNQTYDEESNGAEGVPGNDIDGGSVEEDDESMILYKTTREGENGGTKGVGKVEVISYDSRVAKMLKSKKEVSVQITEAGDSNEGMSNSSKKYVVYTIKLTNEPDSGEEIQTRRRYRDFESLREILTRIFPLIIIPPIPPKNYLNLSSLNNWVSSSGHLGAQQNGANVSKKYSYINSTHLTKNKLIEHRKRLLTNFLNNCLNITQIRGLDFFAKFLDPNTNWSDETSIITNKLSKSVFQSNPENGLKTSSLYAYLPSPVSNHTVSFLKDNKKKLSKKTNLLLSNGEVSSNGDSNKESSPLGVTARPNTTHLDEVNKKIMTNFMGLASDYNELGTTLNSLSLVLSESPRTGKIKTAVEEEDLKLNIIFDNIGQVFDRSYIALNAIIGDLETKFSEPLGEVAQYDDIINGIDKFKHRKLHQDELLNSSIKEKKKELEELEKEEEESVRIANAVNNQVSSRNPKYDLTGTTGKADNSTKGSSSSGRFKMLPSLKKITQYVTEIIDQYPEQTRQQKIANLKERISILEQCQTIMIQDINYITDEIDKNFKLFQNKQLKVVYGILLSYNRFLMAWAKKNIDTWEETKEEIEKI